MRACKTSALSKTVRFSVITVFLSGASHINAQSLPEVPSVLRDVNPVESRALSRSHIAPLNMSRDGRIGFESKNVAGNLRFYLLTPERVDTPVHASQSGAHALLSSTAPFLVATDRFFDASRQLHDGGHPAICDPTPSRPQPGDRINPYPCGAGGNDDCYDLTMLYPSENQTNLASLYQTPFTIRVENPKQSNARIAAFEVKGEPKIASTLPVEDRLLETRISGDGRLLVARIGAPNVYASYDDRFPACDFSRWTQTHRLSHAPFDPIARAQFGFARQQFRRADGTPIGDGEAIAGTYPWIDSEANNLVLTTVNARLHYNNGSASRYPARCVDSNDCVQRDDDGSSYRGHAIMGLWTNGKMVQIDNLLNHIDYGMSEEVSSQRQLALYQPNTDRAGVHNGEVRVGAGRFNGDKTFPHGTTTNSAFFDSIENRFNFWKPLRSASFGDVVWSMSNARYTDEFVFDNHINPDALIVSSMVGLRTDRGYFDGWNDATRRFDSQVLLQNGATSPRNRWLLPPHGEVVGNARLEPVAIGGVKGKGLWLDGNTSLRYRVVRQPRNSVDSPWYAGLFIDSRFANDGLERELLRFADGSTMNLRGRERVVVRDDAGAVVWNHRIMASAIALPEKGWAHLGLQIYPGARQIDLFHNGYYVAGFNADEAIFSISPGTLSIGAGADPVRAGFRGWIDDFVLIAQRLNPESLCNQAHGTVLGLPDQYQGPLRALANLYPRVAHDRVSLQLQANNQSRFGKYVCFHDYSADYAATTHALPAGTVALRESINFPEGPVTANAPRPDSTANQFCLSCHTDAGLGGLSLSALARRAMPAHADPRRQPEQPWLLASAGNVPANWLAPALPASHRRHESVPISIDHYYQTLTTRYARYPQNRTPVVNSLSPRISTIGDRISLSIDAMDADGDTLRYSVSGLPAGLNVDANTGLISGRIEQSGAFDPLVSVDDGKGEVARFAFDWDVSGDYVIKAVSDGDCVQPSSDSGRLGDHLETAICTGHARQQWRFEFFDRHRVKLIHKMSSLAAAVTDADLGHNHPVTLHIDRDDDNYLMKLSSAGSNGVQFVFEHSQYCLYEEGGYLVRQGRCIYARSSNFQIESIDANNIVPSLSVVDTAVSEGDGRVAVAVMLSKPVSEEVRVLAFTQSRSARGGADYYGKTQLLQFAAGQTRQLMNVTILDDSIAEATETVAIRLAQAENARIEKAQATLSIADNDSNGLPTLRIEPATVNESNGPLVARLILSEPSRQEVTATIHTSAGSARGGADYYGFTEQITLAPGQRSLNFPIQILNDTVRENDEVFSVRIASISNATAGESAQFTIRDDD